MITNQQIKMVDVYSLGLDKYQLAKMKPGHIVQQRHPAPAPTELPAVIGVQYSGYDTSRCSAEMRKKQLQRMKEESRRCRHQEINSNGIQEEYDAKLAVQEFESQILESVNSKFDQKNPCFYYRMILTIR
ncbi:hypothetical protein KQX54_020115 [Cotesia glomerata]|uniref:Uncharacterized protein n=1 Tax=Cotesia glomerata TaxID=32391 RepID=A0AAV7IAE3_COTGL|nr:hypothetical protein KQX54_020115 [Cotesia glomerata]